MKPASQILNADDVNRDFVAITYKNREFSNVFSFLDVNESLSSHPNMYSSETVKKNTSLACLNNIPYTLEKATINTCNLTSYHKASLSYAII